MAGGDNQDVIRLGGSVKPNCLRGRPADAILNLMCAAAVPAGPSFASAQVGEDGYLTGQFLVAMPSMSDPRFAQSVIYICAHTNDGAMGLVVNRPIAEPSFDELLQQLEIGPNPPARRMPLHFGGPVENARGFVLHTTDWTGDGSLLVDDSIALTASLDVLQAVATGGGPQRGLLALGYAGWGPGQLDEEIQRNDWLSLPAPLDLLFDDVPDAKWRRAFDTMRIDPILLSSVAGHA